MEQLSLVTSCDSPAGIGASLRTHGLTDGWTDRRDVGNSILDYIFLALKSVNASQFGLLCNFQLGVMFLTFKKYLLISW